MDKEEIQKQVLEAIASGKLQPATIVLGDNVAKKIVVESGGVAEQTVNNYYGQQFDTPSEQTPTPEQAPADNEYIEITDGTMEQHLRLFKAALLKAQDIVYKSEHTKLVANTYDWVAAERLGKDIGLLKNYEELSKILKDDNFREVPKNSQNLTPYRTIIAENTKYPNWQCYKPSEDGKFRKFKQFADAIYSLYKLSCENKNIKPFGNM